MSPKFPSDYQRKTIWSALTGLSFLVLALLLATFIWATGKALGLFQPVLVPLAVAGIIAYLLDPVVTWVQKKGLSRLKSVMAVFATFSIAILVFGFMVIPPIVKQLNDKENLDALSSNSMKVLHSFRTQPWVEHWLERPKKKTASATPKSGDHTNTIKELESIESEKPKAADQNPSSESVKAVPFSETRLASLLPEDIVSKLALWLRGGTSKIFGILGMIVGFAMLPIYLYYFLKESSGIKAHWHEYVPLRASHFKDEVVETLSEINGYLISFFRGQLLVAMIDGILVGIALWIFGLPYGLIIGMCMAILGVIPYIGNIICLIPACIIAYVHFSLEVNQGWLGVNPWMYVAAVCVIFFVVQQINSLATAPKIVGDSVGLHPMTVIFSMLFWTILLGGFIGALLAVPLTAALKVLFRRYIWEPQMNEPIPASIAPMTIDPEGRVHENCNPEK